MQPTPTLRGDGINHLDRLWCGKLLKVGLPVGRSGGQVLEDLCVSSRPCSWTNWPRRMDVTHRTLS